MSLPPGTRLGTYEIVAPLGTGGMGEVFRARDTRLGREVAIKVLPADVASHPDRLARFERDAKTVAVPTTCPAVPAHAPPTRTTSAGWTKPWRSVGARPNRIR